jgi:CheY-like chemotaxis protein
MPKCTDSYQRFGSVRIEVHDEGPGITEQGKEMLFREGVQLNPNQLQSGQGLFAYLFSCHLLLLGSGLGLWIAKGITSIHGGTIGVECEEVGKGSMFFVELPLIQGLQSSPQSSQPQSSSLGIEVSVGGNNKSKESVLDEAKSDTIVGKRIWRWRDPRNNVDHKNVITPTSKRNPPPDPRIQPKKVIPFDPTVSTSPPQGTAVDSTPEVLTEKQICPFLSSETSQTNSPTRQKFNPGSPSPQVSPHPSLRILVVDDVKSIRKLFARALSNQGHTCDTACDGQECVDLFTKKSEPSSTVPVDVCPYDLVLMDSEMPVMNGPTATKIIRSLGFKELVIFGVTGNVLPEDVEMFMDHGVDAVLGKPLTVERIWEEYDQLLHFKSLKEVE